MQKARRHPIIGLRPLVSNTVSNSISPSYSEFFSPFPHGTCSLSVSQEYLALPDGAGSFNRDSSGPDLLRILLQILWLLVRDSHPLRLTFPNHSISHMNPHMQSFNPIHAKTSMVWASPISLATTLGITIVFSSSGYLDVSVPRVCAFASCLQHDRFSHSDICGSTVVAPLHSFSQLTTSFFASESLGIHCVPLISLL